MDQTISVEMGMLFEENRNLRNEVHAIESAWFKSKLEYFFSKLMDKPSNAYFIALIAEQVKLGKIEYSA